MAPFVPVSEHFTAVLQERHLVVPLDARGLWGEARPSVRGTVNGVPYRSRLAVYGGETVLGLTNAFRAQAGLSDGDKVEVTMERDDRWIAEKEETRERRAAKAIEMLRAGVKTPG